MGKFFRRNTTKAEAADEPPPRMNLEMEEFSNDAQDGVGQEFADIRVALEFDLEE